MRPLLALLAACSSPLGPGYREVAIAAPGPAGLEWAWTWQHCGSRWVAAPRVAFAQVRWVTVLGGNGSAFESRGQGLAAGFWAPGRRTIGLSRHAAGSLERDAVSVRVHEMLHAQTGILVHLALVFGSCEQLLEVGP